MLSTPRGLASSVPLPWSRDGEQPIRAPPGGPLLQSPGPLQWGENLLNMGVLGANIQPGIMLLGG